MKRGAPGGAEEPGEDWADPRPMKTTSLRMPAEIVDALKAQAQAQGLRYSTLVRRVLERYLAHSESDSGISELEYRIERLERRMDSSVPVDIAFLAERGLRITAPGPAPAKSRRAASSAAGVVRVRSRLRSETARRRQGQESAARDPTSRRAIWPVQISRS